MQIADDWQKKFSVGENVTLAENLCFLFYILTFDSGASVCTIKGSKNAEINFFTALISR